MTGTGTLLHFSNASDPVITTAIEDRSKDNMCKPALMEKWWIQSEVATFDTYNPV